MDVKTNKELIIELLSEVPELRDDDYQLISLIWESQAFDVTGDYGSNISALQFFSDFAKGKYSHPESIRRARAKIQEQMPELRGGKYNERQRHQGEVIIQLPESSNELH